MKNVRYVGPSGTGVTIVSLAEDRPRGVTSVTCRPGETVQLPDQVADRHIAAGTFEAVGDKPAEEKPKRAKATAEPTEQKEDD